MMKHVSVLLQVVLILGGDKASAAAVEAASLDSNRDLIGFNHMDDIQSSQNSPRTEIESRIDVTEAPSASAPAVEEPVVPGAPTKPSKFPTKPPTPFPTRGEPSSSPTAPTATPSLEPTTAAPTGSSVPTDDPSTQPTEFPSSEPSTSEEPTATPFPTEGPTVTAEPSASFVEGRVVDNDRGSFATSELMTISEIICEADNGYLWESLCVALKEAKYLELLGDVEREFTIFAPTNEAFDNSDYRLKSLVKDEAALRNLMSMHIAPSSLQYDALACDLNIEMLNFDITYTLCLGGVRVQTADGNELRNLPIIGEPDNIQAMNGMIHAVNNLIVPLKFSPGNVNGIDNKIDDNDFNTIASDVLDDDSEAIDVADETTNSTSTGGKKISLATAMESVSGFLANRHDLSHNGDEERCWVCESRELCAIPRTAKLLVPGEGEVPCVTVVKRQNSAKGITMGASMCKALQQRFQESCLIGPGGN